MLAVPGQLIDWGVPGAFALGVLTALQPCPLATNLAALALLRGWNSAPRRVLLSGVSLIAGMCTLYSLLAFGMAANVLRATRMAAIAKELASLFIGPLIMLVGGLMTGFLDGAWRVPLRGVAAWFNGVRLGIEVKAFALGVVLAAAFCPVSAGIFFAVLLPVAIAHGQPGIYAVAFGAGFGVPMIAILLGLSLGVLSSERVRQGLHRLPQFAGWGLVGVGAWLTWQCVVR